MAGVDGTLAKSKQLENNFGCGANTCHGVCKWHFAMTNKPWPELMGRWLKSKNTNRFGCGVNKESILRWPKREAGADGTQTEDKQLEKYFGCGVGTAVFAVTNQAWPELMEHWLKTKKLGKYFGCGVNMMHLR